MWYPSARLHLLQHGRKEKLVLAKSMLKTDVLYVHKSTALLSWNILF